MSVDLSISAPPADRTVSDDAPMRPRAAAVAAAVVILLAQLPFVVLHFRNLLRYRPHYEFFPILILAVVVLFRTRWSNRSVSEFRWSSALGIVLLSSGLLALLGSVLLFAPTLAAVAFILTLGGVLIRLRGWTGFRPLLPAWLLLWLVVPPPNRLDETLIVELRGMTSVCSSLLLDAIGVTHMLEGNVIEVPDRRLLVEDACSGINSLFVLIAAAAIFAVWNRRSLFRSLALISAAVFWALLLNVIRVTAVAVAWDRWQLDITQGWPHEAMGLGLLAVAVLALISTEQLLSFFFGSVTDTGFQIPARMGSTDLHSTDMESNPLSRWWNRIISGVATSRPEPTSEPAVVDTEAGRSWSLAAIGVPVVLLGLMQLSVVGSTRQFDLPDSINPELFNESFLSDVESTWAVKGFETVERDAASDEGQYSSVWAVLTPLGPMDVSVDYPFMGWHELTRCYRATGWQVDRREVVPASDEDGGDFVELEVSKPSGQRGFLLFSLLDRGGRPVKPRSTHVKTLTARLLSNPLFGRFRRELATALPDSQAVQIQQFVPLNEAIRPELRSGMRESFLRVREHVRRSVTAHGGTGAVDHVRSGRQSEEKMVVVEQGLRQRLVFDGAKRGGDLP